MWKDTYRNYDIIPFMKHDFKKQTNDLASFLLEVGLLYVLMFFIERQQAFPQIASYLAVGLIPILAFYAHRLEHAFKVPFFVWAIGLGSLFRSSLEPIFSNTSSLTWITTFLGILIIFGGGLELKYHQFKRLLFPILSISIIGTIVTSFLFSSSLAGIVQLLHLPLSIGTIGLLGAMLCSTDPAAILPTLQAIRFKNPDTKIIAISESAVNDVLATIITIIFVQFTVNAVSAPATLIELYAHLFSFEVLFDFLKEIVIGVGVGYVSFHILNIWRAHKPVSLANFPFLIGIAISSFSLSTLWGGSGFLAAFIAGLLFDFGSEEKDLAIFYTQIVDGFIKPSIFVLLGGLILPSFIGVAGLGLLVSVLFIFFIRPIAVFASLGWFIPKQILSFKDLLFLDAIRETGVIPAVLLLSYIPRLADGELAFSIGTWVILSTLIVLPLTTHWWAKRLNIAR